LQSKIFANSAADNAPDYYPKNVVGGAGWAARATKRRDGNRRTRRAETQWKTPQKLRLSTARLAGSDAHTAALGPNKNVGTNAPSLFTSIVPDRYPKGQDFGLGARKRVEQFARRATPLDLVRFQAC
jgi:hypothetical protein